MKLNTFIYLVHGVIIIIIIIIIIIMYYMKLTNHICLVHGG